MSTPTIDIAIEDHGTVWAISGRTDAGREWIDENVCAPDEMSTPSGVYADWRCGRDIMLGAIGDGLNVELRGVRNG